MSSFTNGYVFLFFWLFAALFNFGSAQDILSNSIARSIEDLIFESSSSLGSSRSELIAENAHHLQRKLLATDSCITPPQPENGVRRRHKHHCGDFVQDCEIREGVELAPSNLLTYTCNPGFRLEGNSEVLCQGRGGTWSAIPVCVELKCDALSSTTTTAKCFRLGRWVSCDSSVLTGTRAKISCRPGYVEPVKSSTNQSAAVECGFSGKWEPEPIECVPVCGAAMNETRTGFPWHASLYKRLSKDNTKSFICGATVIRPNLVISAARCVWLTKTNTTRDPEDLFVMTGNGFMDYDHPLHDPKLVWKSAVKAVHLHCDYKPTGDRDSVADIVLLETRKPFEFSQILLPACLYDTDNDQGIIRPGSIGKVPEFGATTIGGRPTPNGVLSLKDVPYVSYDNCKESEKILVRSTVTRDKFCGGFKERSSICVTNEGGGLVFQKDNLWYIMGVVSGIPLLERSGFEQFCDYWAVYTNVSEYTAWIQDVIFNLERYKRHPPCNLDGSPNQAMMPPTGDENSENGVVPPPENAPCKAPPQPRKGKWRMPGYPCKNDTNCDTPQGIELKPGTRLVYTCVYGYVASGSTDVYCGSTGNWSTIPDCIAIRCNRLNSASTLAACYGPFGEWISCDSPVPPGTRAELSCRLGYRPDSAFGSFRRENVKCDENGKWTPDPITCAPVCGVTISHQVPLAIGAAPAKLGDFPWHATLYRETKSSKGIVVKKFICGASIIHANFLLTAAHCIYDETGQKTVGPEKFHVMTGNIFRDYDYKEHNPDVVKKRPVRNVYMPCKYYGLRGNYASDIALLEVKDPFEFSGILLPICLDVEGYTEQILGPGAFGRVAGFGRTQYGASSAILQTLTLPFIPFKDCKPPQDAHDNNVLNSKDKFCAGYKNGSAVCEGDSGGGLVFQKGELWYVMGVVSVGLGVDLENGEKTCDRYSYSLYTKVSEHMLWIQDVMFQRAQGKSFPSCDANV